MTTEEWIKVVEEGLKIGIKEWEIGGGGEPFMHGNGKTVIEIIEMVKNYGGGCRIELSTNGTLFSPEVIESFVELEVDSIIVGIDGPNVATHDYLRGFEGSFDKVTKNIELFNKIKDEKKSDKPNISVHAVLCKKNYKKIPEMVTLMKKLKVSAFAIKRLIEGEGNKNVIDKIKLSSKNFEYVKSRARYFKFLTKKYKIPTFFFEGVDLDFENYKLKIPRGVSINENKQNLKGSNFLDMFLSLSCFDPWYRIFIDPYGRIKFCNCFTGEFLETFENLSEAWSSKYFEDIRKAIIEKKLSDFCFDSKNGCDRTRDIKKRFLEFLKEINTTDNPNKIKTQ